MTSHAPSSQAIFISDCEGPVSRNDNAFELASHFIPEGSRLFTFISRYDDVLADIVKRNGYKAGDTLKLILPFLKAYNVSNAMMTVFSLQNMLLVPAAKEMLAFVRRSMPAYIVSTSYEQYMRALCDVIGFPFEDVICTHLDLDRYEIVEEEKEELKRLAEEIVKLPMLEIPKSAQYLRELPKRMQLVVKKLDGIFWEDIAGMKIGRVLCEVNPVGGYEKAAAIKGIVTKSRRQLCNVMYVGDSITDVVAFQLVRQAGGLTVSFNGNGYAVREAEIAVMSENAVVTAVLAVSFTKLGKTGLMSFIREWNPDAVEKLDLFEPLKRSFLKTCGKKFPKVELVTERNMEKLAQESINFRKCVRGEAIGKLG